MTTEHLPGLPEDRLGVIGSRQLITVQTLDIARLRPHPVVLIPGTFVAVTGMGPVDSNESGKTSFLAAVSLLLGDPEWRITGNGVVNVAGLLFEPITAGLPAGEDAADEGYVVGVFADPGEVESTAHTVWMKISSARPHLEVRHERGVHLARGTDDQGYHDAAAVMYRSLGDEPLGSTEYARKLYGRSPRVLAHVARRGNVYSRPSLLKLDAGTFTPEQIGDALITLTGRATLFDRDQEDRKDVAAKQTELLRRQEEDRRQIDHEERMLRQVGVRNRLRDNVEAASALWQKHLARAVLDTYVRAASARTVARVATGERKQLQKALAEAAEKRASLQDEASVRQAAESAEIVLNRLERTYDETMQLAGALRFRLGEHERELRTCRTLADGYDPTRDGSAFQRQSAVELFADDAETRRHTRDARLDEVRRLESALSLALSGWTGGSGQLVRALQAEGVEATSIAEGISLAPSARTQWETRLGPWREALCVAPESLPKALQLLAAEPGTIVLSPSPSDSPRTVAADGQQHRLPPGVLGAPAQALPLLWALASHSASESPAVSAYDPDVGAHVIGGFEAPVIGGDELREHLRQALAAEHERLEAAKRELAAATAQLDHATIELQKATAAERAVELAADVKKQTDDLSALVNTTLPSLRAERADARTAHATAVHNLEERTQRMNELTDVIRSAEGKLEKKDTEILRLREQARPDDFVLAAWGRGLEAACTTLGWPLPNSEIAVVEKVVEQAEPPETGSEVERRSAIELATSAHEVLAVVHGLFDYGVDGAGNPPPELRELVASYRAARSAREGRAAQLFSDTVTHLQGWLGELLDEDLSAPDNVQRARSERKRKIDFVGSQARQLSEALAQTQRAIVERSRSALKAVSDALNKLNEGADGFGAKLDYEIAAPSSPDQDWICSVTPKWRRNPGGPHLPYGNATNTAQEKLFSIHLVLAALLAAPDPRGRVLILDELADSLGAEHRRAVLEAIATVAKQHDITVLATCQDLIINEAGPHCGEVLYFHYPSKTECLNRPTRMFGYDSNGRRVELTADALTEGRRLDG